MIVTGALALPRGGVLPMLTSTTGALSASLVGYFFFSSSMYAWRRPCAAPRSRYSVI